MAFPTITGQGGTGIGSSISPAILNIPPEATPGALLLGFLRTAVNVTHTWPGTWTVLFNENPDGSGDTVSCAYYFTPDAAEAGLSIDIATSGTSKGAGWCWSITGADTPQVSTRATGASTTPDPPNFTPVGGSKDYLWLWCGCCEGEQTSPPTGNPTNYSNPGGDDSGTAGAVTSNCRVFKAERILTAASEDPPSWTISASDDWTAFVIAVPPAPPPVAKYGTVINPRRPI